MTRFASTCLAVIFALSAAPLCHAAQAPVSIEQFLSRVAPTQPKNNAENEQFAQETDLLSHAPRSEVEKVIPSLLAYVDNNGGNPRARGYAAIFLLGIAMRPDVAGLLSPHGAEIAQLLTDSNPPIQRVAVTIITWLIGRNGGQDSKTFIPALLTAVKSSTTTQEVAAQAVFLLMNFGSSDPDVVAAVHAFLIRSDLNYDAKAQTLRTLSVIPDLPDEISQDLCSRFDDPDPQVRVVAIIAYSEVAATRRVAANYLSGKDPIPSEDPAEAAIRRKAFSAILNSKSSFYSEAQKRVERIAADENENPKLRQLAKDALAGRTGLDPNILNPNYVPNVKPADTQ